ncbi:MAG: hypothetical protein DI552_00355 [Brevundimonas sp.]|uniref:tyrosine-type recombinase/integrase n=1 Tax=Brevundimonas sp. TaxID=1871086 RepID=UPI000DBC3902|nr:tyrosine-type recombinase/integrase [Brevundimonas sp.]PZU62189.1 MAG: hypothetical protein DI552_00355 [Brevundimonas sp.]
MSRHAKGPRLYLRKGRRKADGSVLPDRYFIRDGTVEIGTGCGPDRLSGAGGAEEQLAEYILAKMAQPAAVPDDIERARKSDPTQVFVAEVLAEYAAGAATELADPGKEANFIETLLPWWSEYRVSDVRRSLCKAYVEKRTADPIKAYRKDPANAPRVSDQTARRELECLSTAIGKWNEEHHLRHLPKVWLPAKAETPRDALTRSQAALILWASMGWQLKDGKWRRPSTNARTNRMHLRRFILISLYTGSRSGVTTTALWEQSPQNPWADLDSGILYRRGRDQREQRTKLRPVVKFPRRLLAHMERWRRLDQERGIASVIHFNKEPVQKVKTAMRSCVADAGLDPEISAHWFRHTCATWLMERGADPWEAAGFLGMSVTMLLKNYGHHRPDYQAGVSKLFG